MSSSSNDDETPPDSAPPESPPEQRGSGMPPGQQRESRRRRLEGVIPEIVRRAVELGVEKAQDAPGDLKQFISDMKVPKEIAHYLLGQIDETKNGLFRVVAKEIRDFLEHTNFAGEVQNLLTTVQFEVNTTIRFTPNDGKKKKNSSPPPDDGGGGGGGDDDEVNATKSPSSAPPDNNGENAGRNPLPRPEVKTSVHMQRNDQRERSTRRRDRA